MSRKISMAEKRQWLEEHETGLSEHSLKKKYSKDIRTIKNGLENARRDRDISMARVELMKDVLLKHQRRMLDRLHSYQSSPETPRFDYEVLSWNEGNNSVFSPASTRAEAGKSIDPVLDMLQQHLKGDKVWKLLEERRQQYVANMAAREALQRKIFASLKRFGYPVVDQPNGVRRRLYVYSVGPLFYRRALTAAVSGGKSPVPELEVTSDPQQHAVMYHRNTLVEGIENPAEARKALIRAYHRVRRLPEVRDVVASYNALKEKTDAVYRAIDEILLIDYIRGDCQVCRHLLRG